MFYDDINNIQGIIGFFILKGWVEVAKSGDFI
jgi:hypothetical protein